MKLTPRRQDTRALTRPTRWSPFTQLNRLREEINRVFEEPFGGFVDPASGFFEGWTPSLDVYEDKDTITVKAELPGMKKEEIEVSFTGDALTISGERKQEQENKSGEMYRSERYFGRFQRSVTLPQPVDPNKIQASYKEGILTVTCHKSEEAKRKQVGVHVS